MTISELIDHVGDENVEIQWLNMNLIEAKLDKGRAWIKFATDPAKVQAMACDTEKHFGLVVWLPRDKMPDFSEEKGEGSK